MTNRLHSVPEWPVVELVLGLDGTASVNGRKVKLPGLAEPNAELMEQAVGYAETLGRPVRVRATSPAGTWQMVAHPDGEVTTTRRPDPAAGSWLEDPHALQSPRRRATPFQPAALRAADPPPPPPDPPLAQAPPASGPSASAEASSEVATVDTGQAPDPPAPPGEGWAIGAETAVEVIPEQEAAPPAGAGLQQSAFAPSVRVAPTGRGRRPARGISLGAAAAWAVGIVALVVAAAMTAPRDDSTPAPPAAANTVTSSDAAPQPQPAARPQPLDAAAPGFSTRPLWSQQVSADTENAVDEDGAILTRSPDGTLVRLQAGTGATTWSTLARWDTEWAGPRLATIDGHRAAVLVSRASLVYWTLPPADQAVGPVGPPTVVRLPAQATVSWVGSSPLVTTAKGFAGVVHGNALDAMALPAGVWALATDGTDVIATQGPRWLRITPSGTPTAHPYPTPPGITGDPARVVAVGDDYLLAVWSPRGGAETVALISVATGKTLTQGNLPAGVHIAHASVVRQVNGTTTAVGPVVVDTDLKKINVLQVQYKVRALTSGHVYASTATSTSDIALSTTGKFTVEDFTDAQAPIPFAVTSVQGRRVALILIPDGTGWSLQALPAT